MNADVLERAPAARRGVTVWFAVLGGIGAWAVHLLLLAGVVEWTCGAPTRRWVMHAATAATALATVTAMALSWRLLRVAGDADEGGGDAPGRTMFLGRLGLLVGAVNLALILLEGLFVPFFNSCA